MKYAFERTLKPEHALAGRTQFFTNIVGARSSTTNGAGKRDHRHRRRRRHAHDPPDPAAGRLPHAARDAIHRALSRSDLPPRRVTVDVPIPSAGPVLHLRAATSTSQLIAQPRIPNYHGPRPQRFDTHRVRRSTVNEETALPAWSCPAIWTRARLPAAHGHEIGQSVRPGQPRRGARTSAVLRGVHQCASAILPMNTSRPTFANVNMRKAVNYAVDRTAYAAPRGPYAGDAARPVPRRRAMPGFEDINVYSRPSGPRARRATSRAGIPETPAADHRLLPLEWHARTRRSTRSSASNLDATIGFDATGGRLRGRRHLRRDRDAGRAVRPRP